MKWLKEMVEATDAHVTISGNLCAPLRVHGRGVSYRFLLGMNARIAAAHAFCEPDVRLNHAARSRLILWAFRPR